MWSRGHGDGKERRERAQHVPAAPPDRADGEYGDTGDDEELDVDQQLFSENDDPAPLEGIDQDDQMAEAADDPMLGLTPAQRAARVANDAGHWEPRAGSTQRGSRFRASSSKHGSADRR